MCKARPTPVPTPHGCEVARFLLLATVAGKGKHDSTILFLRATTTNYDYEAKGIELHYYHARRLLLRLTRSFGPGNVVKCANRVEHSLRSRHVKLF